MPCLAGLTFSLAPQRSPPPLAIHLLYPSNSSSLDFTFFFLPQAPCTCLPCPSLSFFFYINHCLLYLIIQVLAQGSLPQGSPLTTSKKSDVFMIGSYSILQTPQCPNPKPLILIPVLRGRVRLTLLPVSRMSRGPEKLMSCPPSSLTAAHRLACL